MPRPLLVLLLSFSLLAGCEWSFPDLPGGGLRQVRIFDKTLTVAAPPGYCIDPSTSVEKGETAVALIGRCTAGGDVAAALVSLTLGPPGSAGVLAAGPEVLGKFFASSSGRRLLARDGVASHVKVTQTIVSEGALYLRLDDRDAGDYWRAVSAVKGRLLTVSASGAMGAPLTPEQGLALVQETIVLMDKKNAEKRGAGFHLPRIWPLAPRTEAAPAPAAAVAP